MTDDRKGEKAIEKPVARRAHHLLDVVVEVAARKHLLNLLVEPPVRGHVGDVGLFSRATTAGEHADDGATPLEDDGARISGGREGAPLPVARQDGYLDGRLLDAVFGVDASERVQPVDTTYGGARGQAVLHHVEALVAVGVELLGRADLLVLHDAMGLEETVARVLVAGLVFGSGEHNLAVVRRREVPACGDKYNCQLKPRDDTVARDGKRTNIDFVALERVPVDLFLVEFNQCPVAGELVGSVADGDGFDVEDETDDAL